MAQGRSWTGWVRLGQQRAMNKISARTPGGEKNQQVLDTRRPTVCWPSALRKVRGWLEPWLMLGRYWRAWSQLPPPPELQALLTWVQQGLPIDLYEPL